MKKLLLLGSMFLIVACANRVGVQTTKDTNGQFTFEDLGIVGQIEWETSPSDLEATHFEIKLWDQNTGSANGPFIKITEIELTPRKICGCKPEGFEFRESADGIYEGTLKLSQGEWVLTLTIKQSYGEETETLNIVVN